MRVWLLQVALAFDQLGNALMGGMADETISAHAYRRNWVRRQRLINWIFRDPNHCYTSFQSEQFQRHLPEIYRRSVFPK